MAPEQVRGDVADARSDIWALGVLLYEMLAGRAPFAGATVPELFASVLTAAPQPLPSRVPPGVRAVVERCLEPLLVLFRPVAGSAGPRPCRRGACARAGARPARRAYRLGLLSLPWAPHYERALRELQTARAGAPGHAEIAAPVGFIMRRQGRWREDMPPRNELLHGTLETLILRTLAHGPMHGYAIVRWLEEATADVLRIEDGSLYPALYRMEQRGWVEPEWGTSDGGRRAKFYRLTPEGRSRLAASTKEWARFSAAVSKVLLPA